MGLIQEHFKKNGATLFDLFGPSWWNLSSGAVGESRGRRSGGCAIFGQPGLQAGQGFQHKSGRICGLFTSGGLLLSVYFPTKRPKQLIDQYKEMFSTFVDDLIIAVDKYIGGHSVSWIACGADLNAHFGGCGIPPRRKDDFAATQVRRFMTKFSLVSLGLELYPDRFTCLNSRGGATCLDTFLVSGDLYSSGCVKMYEVLDFIEHGSDHSPVYLRLRVYPSWGKKCKPPNRRILNKSGMEHLRRRLSAGSRTRKEIVHKINNTFSQLEWSKATTREDMNGLWDEWIKRYTNLVEELIGTRWARVSSWGRKFNSRIRKLCVKASIARSWFIEAKRAGGDYEAFLESWKRSRKEFIEAWEQVNRNWYIECVERAISGGDIAVWRLLSDKWKKTSRSMANAKGTIFTDPKLIEAELHSFHDRSKEENSSVPPGSFEPVTWDKPFSDIDEVLEVPNVLVVGCIIGLKNSSVPDSITPDVIKLLFGAEDLVNPLGEMIRAVVRTRVFPEGGKKAKQIFCWKGVGVRNNLDNCRTITMGNILLKLAESCIKKSASAFWNVAGFPRSYWGHFFGAPESIYVWQSTVEKYSRLNMVPETALTDVSRAFDRLNHGLFKRKLFNFGLPRQLIELVMEFISGIKVCLSWGNVKTKLLERGNTGVPQGSLEGMWNFGVYSDNIQDAILDSLKGITVGSEFVRAVIYEDDISPITGGSSATNLVLNAVSKAGTYNSYKFKPSKCKVVGSIVGNDTKYILGGRFIERAKDGLLLGALVDGRGISNIEHISRRTKMVDTPIRLIKSWRTKGLPFRVTFRHLFISKLVPRFCYAFALLDLKEWGTTHDLVQTTLARALCSTFGWSVPKRFKVQPGIWFIICGFPTVLALLRKLKLEMAARLKVANNRAGRIFRSLYESDKGSFENDVYLALKEWLLLGDWNSLSKDTLTSFKKKVSTISKKCWPKDLQKKDNLTWLYHNHRVFSGNVPMWADWGWPQSKNMEVFKLHFFCLLIGQHPAGGPDARCSYLLCKDKLMGTVYDHHFFKCVEYSRNRFFFSERCVAYV